MDNNIDYEKEIKKLEEIIKVLELGEISIDEEVELFEKGSKIIKNTSKKLESVKGKISIIKQGIEEEIKN